MFHLIIVPLVKSSKYFIYLKDVYTLIRLSKAFKITIMNLWGAECFKHKCVICIYIPQRCCRCACQISERLEKLKPESRGSETSQDLGVRPSAWWILLVICAVSSSVTGEFLNKRLSKQSWGWRFETPSRSLWRHCNDHRIQQTSNANVLLIV